MSRSHLIPRREDFFAPLEQQFHRFFEEFWNPKGLDSLKATAGFPKTNAYEKDGELVLVVSASGMTSDDLRVEVTPDGHLVISGKMAEEYQPPEDAQWYLRELRQSAFERRFRLPDSVEGDPLASLKDGVLTLRWALKGQKAEAAASKRIKIACS